MIPGVVGLLALFAAMVRAEAPQRSASFIALGSMALAGGIGWLNDDALKKRLLDYLYGLKASGDPILDARRLGPFAMQIVHGCLASIERQARRSGAKDIQNDLATLFKARGRHASGSREHAQGPVIVVQCESFFDIRRIHPGLSRTLLPAFDRCCREALQHGRLDVPAIAANTSRTEFTVLTGLPPSVTGFDRYNPYHRFARGPLHSLASRLRDDGYQTICLHPFDRRFYGRDQVMRHLGFDRFIGEEGFAGAERHGGYVSDAAVARQAFELLESYGPRLFLFIVTMENHGPWTGARTAEADDQGALSTLTSAFPKTERDALRGVMRGIHHGDAMLGMLTDGLRARSPDGLLAFYGDHLPGLPETYARFGFRDHRSDYLIWQATGSAGVRRDIAAEDLHHTLLDAHFRDRQEEPTRRPAITSAA